MARNPDGTVTLKTTGKVASTPTSGSAETVRPAQARATPAKQSGPKIVPDGRAPVKRSSLSKAASTKSPRGGRRSK